MSFLDKYGYIKSIYHKSSGELNWGNTFWEAALEKVIYEAMPTVNMLWSLVLIHISVITMETQNNYLAKDL